MTHAPDRNPRHLVLVLGDQLDRRSAAFDTFDASRDAVWMAETHREATHVWCHKLRLAFFFSAMRHFREELRSRGVTVHYHELTQRKSEDRGETFGEILPQHVRALRPKKLIVVHPGDHRVKQMLSSAAEESSIPLEILDDNHFYCASDEFRAYAEDRDGLLLEHFYHWMRKRHKVLLTPPGKPEGGLWNFDKENRETFGTRGPGRIKPPRRFQADDLTRQVLALVERRFGDHPGSVEHFHLPVTREQALGALRDFTENRLHGFGTYEDAMWTDEPFLYHSRLSAPLNVKLLNPRECVEKAIDAYCGRRAPINDVEGFVRQILGWREFVRGVYWLHMPTYMEKNALECAEDADVPPFYWDGRTEMNCVKHCMRSVIDHAYTHHIARLMVLGLFAQLLGVHPRRFHDWHMAMYADAIDWVSLPNTLGMSQFGDGGIVGTKPYCASGNYIHRMSNFCKECRYDPKQAAGPEACPFTSLYWDFLARHRDRFAENRRMGFQIRNLDRKGREELQRIRKRARDIQAKIAGGERI